MKVLLGSLKIFMPELVLVVHVAYLLEAVHVQLTDEATEVIVFK